jgi:hypothetical protein
MEQVRQEETGNNRKWDSHFRGKWEGEMGLGEMGQPLFWRKCGEMGQPLLEKEEMGLENGTATFLLFFAFFVEQVQECGPRDCSWI